MSFDFEAAELEGLKDVKSNKLFLIMLGPSGSGKSRIIGTLGVKTLYVYGSGEKHGPNSAKVMGKDNIVPVCFDKEGGKQLSPEAAMTRLMTILADVNGIKERGFGAVAIDGLSEIEQVLFETQKLKLAKAANGFSAGSVEVLMMRPIIDALRNLQSELDLHVVVTCIIHTKEFADDGSILDASPGLYGYQVASSIIQQFGDILVVGRMVLEDKVVHRIQPMANVSKTTKDPKGEVRKTMNFSTRMKHLDITTFPETIAADLSILVRKIEETKNVNG